MTDRPYTDDDLRTEAARQHKTATEDPDFMGIGEQMDGSEIDSTFYDEAGQRHENGRTWDQLDDEEFEAAQRAIDDLLGKAADVSDWAINLGADDLEPSDEHAITVDGDGRPIARIHFAFEPGMPQEMRDALVQGIGEAIADAL
ncbi:hypothetical protein AB0D11_02215 [Streptomyces monashensis]|uniref:hypothetical protein n=1 Tax=Streptomyces monashensis TaxID=1678012 RepID=UPI0034052C0A